MGASDVTVTNFTAIGTLADGLHFNADRRVTVDGLVAVNTGDDGLAFVTYYDPSQLWTYGPTDGPFNQAGVGAWNNGGSVASHIFVTGGRANGVRVQGGYDITISDITVTDKDFGIQLNSAKATGPGDWTSLASRDVHFSNVTIDGAQTAIVLATNNIDGTEDPMWWDFAGSSISDVTITGAKNWSLAVETPATITSKFAGITLRHIRAESMAADGPFGGGNGGILLASLHDSVIDDVQLVSDHSGDINLLGAGQLRSALSAEDLPSSNLDVNDLVLRGPGRILIQDIAGVHFGNVASYGADSSAVILYRVKGASFDHIGAYMPGRGSGEGYGVRLLQVFDIGIQDIEVTIDDHIGTTWWAIELGGESRPGTSRAEACGSRTSPTSANGTPPGPTSSGRADPTARWTGSSRPPGATVARPRRSGGRRCTATPVRSEPSTAIARLPTPGSAARPNSRARSLRESARSPPRTTVEHR